MLAKPNGALNVEATGKDWRVRWPAYGVVKETLRQWCRENAQGSFYIHKSHIRFINEDDAYLCFLTFS